MKSIFLFIFATIFKFVFAMLNKNMIDFGQAETLIEEIKQEIEVINKCDARHTEYWIPRSMYILLSAN